MKYIVMSVKSNGVALEIPVVFPDILVHAFMATTTKCALEEQFPGAEVVPLSAGFLSSMDCQAECYGKSETLNLESRGPADDHLIKMADYGSMYNA